MVTPDDWHVGVKIEHIDHETQYEILSEQGGPNPALIDTVYIPVSLPWSDNPEIIEVYPQKVSANERGSGTEILYSARYEANVPNTDDYWEVEMEIWEYPPNVFNTADLSHSENITYANWKTSDLLDAIS